MKMRPGDIYFEDYGSFEIVRGCGVHHFPSHIHRSDCLISLTSGQADMVIGEQETRLSAGKSVLIPRLAAHSLWPVDGTPYGYITLCFNSGADFEGASGSHGFQGRALKFIADCQDSFDLAALCDHCHVSKFHLIRQFKRWFGLTPHQYYDNLRIRKIRQGLLSGSPLPDLAYALGFFDQSHMCRTFKKYMAVTPRQYKRSYFLHTRAGEKTASI